jgi:hypothetical protein
MAGGKGAIPMKRFLMWVRSNRLGLVVFLGLILERPAQAKELSFDLQGGQVLTVRAKAEQQQWIVLSADRVLLAAIVNGKLVVQQFTWPAGPQPGPQPDPKPDPQPDPKPDPSARWQIAFGVESNNLDNLTPNQKTVLASLLIREDLSKRGHRFLGVFDPQSAETAVDPALKVWVNAMRGKAPCVAIAPLDGGAIRVYPLPESTDALLKLLANPPACDSSGRCVR